MICNFPSNGPIRKEAKQLQLCLTEISLKGVATYMCASEWHA